MVAESMCAKGEAFLGAQSRTQQSTLQLSWIHIYKMTSSLGPPFFQTLLPHPIRLCIQPL